MSNDIFLPADILIPNNCDLSKWAVIACDQFSSEPAYWERLDRYVGDCPSTLRLILPEARLDPQNYETERYAICSNMNDYLSRDLFETIAESFIYIERILSDGGKRRGLLGVVDLEAYEFAKGSKAPIRASEGTVLDRLPPRVKIRETAALELPHIMVLIDDVEQTVIEPLSEQTASLPALYSFSLSEGGGHITGYRVSGTASERVLAALRTLSGDGAKMIIGDGNHSLAAAKRYWDTLRQIPGTPANHPARYALSEICNVYDPGVTFEPIHRAVFCENPWATAEALKKALPVSGGKGFDITILSGCDSENIPIAAESLGELIARLTDFLDKGNYKVDYIHGEEALRSLSQHPGCFGVLLPSMEKADFFGTVNSGVIFPKKSFSIGEARDKRYYLEARAIKL